MDTYYESAEGQTITRDRALLELERHNITTDGVDLFFSELGDCEEYGAQAVLAWLGY